MTITNGKWRIFYPGRPAASPFVLPPSAFPWARIRCSGDIQAFSMLLGIEYAET